MMNEPTQTPYASPSAVGVKPDARLSQAFLTQAFAWMFAGLLLTAGVAAFVTGSPRALEFAHDWLLLIILAQLALVVVIFPVRIVDLQLDYPMFSVLYNWITCTGPGDQLLVPHGAGLRDRPGESALLRRSSDGEKNRLMVMVSMNSDVSDSWEREGDNQVYFDRYSPSGYALGVDVVVWILTHCREDVSLHHVRPRREPGPAAVEPAARA